MDSQEFLLLKLGEIALKGLNRGSFERILMKNLKRRLYGLGSFQLNHRQSIIYVEPVRLNASIDEVCAACCQVFGIVSVVRCRPCEKNIQAMVETAERYLGTELRRCRSFKVESKRADKNFPMTSIQISQAVGGLLAEKFPDTPVDVHHPDLTVCIELREKYAYIHSAPYAGAGGLPTGSAGRVLSLLSGGLDSPVASWMMARRGAELRMIHFASPPYTSQQALDKVLSLAQELTNWCGMILVETVPFTEIQEEIRRNCPEEYFTLIMRRFMMRIAERSAQKSNCSALVTGESLGQVASQTLTALSVTSEAVSMPILQPLIGMDKVEIVHLAQRIGTYETSILPYEDCCTVFTPRHPAIRPELADVQAAEARLPVEDLIHRAMSGIECIPVKRKVSGYIDS